MLPLTLFFSILLVLIMPIYFSEVYAVSYTTVTTTGTQANDYCGAATISRDGNVWLICGSSSGDASPELGVYTQAGVKRAEVTVTGAAPQALNGLYPLFSGSESDSVLLATASVDGFRKYEFNGTAINLIGEYIPGGCTVSQDGDFAYDSNGYFWFTCTAEDIVIGMNPVTMTAKITSPDLTDGVGVECDGPEAIAADYSVNDVANSIFVVMACDTVDNIVTARVDVSSGTWSWLGLVDGEVPSSGYAGSSDGITVDPFSNMIAMSDAAGLDIYSYNSAGVITAGATNVGTASASACLIDAFIVSNNRVMGCFDTAANLNYYVSNGTGLWHVANYAGFTGTVTLQRNNLGTSGVGGMWVLHQGGSSAASQKFGLIDAIDLESNVADPNAECDNIIEVCIDTDEDGDNDIICTDEDGDGTFEEDECVVVSGSDDPDDVVARYLAPFGINGDTARLLGALMIHLVVFGGVVVMAMKAPAVGSNMTPILGVFMILAGGISTAIGFMPLLYFFAELVIVSAASALVFAKAGSGGSG